MTAISTFHQPVSALKGVGEKRAALLRRLDIFTVGDLLTYFPRAYEDRACCYPIRQAPHGVPCCISATVITPVHHARLRQGLELSKVTAADETGRIALSFFNQRYGAASLKEGQDYIFYGTVQGEGSRKAMTNPLFESLADPPFFTRRVVPIYPLTAGITGRTLSGLITQAFSFVGDEIPEPLPDWLRRAYHLPHKPIALHTIHFPPSMEELEPARRRLIWEEFFLFSLGLSLLRQRREQTPVAPFSPVSLEPFYQALPFSLTTAQKRVIEEIEADVGKHRPMNRLVQGDVGSGKTMVAAAAVDLAAQNGIQSALMAPTELLARQHFHTLSPLLQSLGISVGLLTGSMGTKEKRSVLSELQSGKIQLCIGTHALLSEGVAFANLGLVITDEQHRFGVHQRAALAEKGKTPHVLVLSATPIPRTLALILYGDLDVSVLDELPPGRQPVKTFLIGEDKRARLYEFVRKTVSQGQQAYWVCPAIEEREDPQWKAVKQYAEYLQSKVFPDLRVGCVHGQMAAKEKDDVMQSFASGALDLLVATTVIEVGVDVPNATLMMVENAERFGLAQLHQLRGRVGRGKKQSYCIFINGKESEESMERLRVLENSNDGFFIASEDLKLRGPGDFFGIRQSGDALFELADIYNHADMLQLAQDFLKEYGRTMQPVRRNRGGISETVL